VTDGPKFGTPLALMDTYIVDNFSFLRPAV